MALDIDKAYEESEQRLQEQEQNQYDNSPYIVDVSNNYPEQQFLFKRDVEFAPLGDLQIIKAKQKAGKTRLCLHLMASALGGEHIGTTCLIQDPRILYVDTEQHILSTVKVVRGALKAAGLPMMEQPKNYRVMNLRKVKTDDRWPRIRQEIKNWEPQLVIIDGVRDIVSSINDEDVATSLNEELMSIAEDSNASIWLLIHVNKNDNNPRGHVGTELQNKASETWEITKDMMNGERVFNVEQVDSRNKEVTKWQFMLDMDGIPVKTYIPDAELESLKEIFKEIAPTSTRKADIIDAYVRKTGKTSRTAYTAFNKAMGTVLQEDPAFRGKWYYSEPIAP